MGSPLFHALERSADQYKTDSCDCATRPLSVDFCASTVQQRQRHPCLHIICQHTYCSDILRKKDDPVGSMCHDIAQLIRHKIDDILRPYGLTRLKWLAIGIIADTNGLPQAGLANRQEPKSAAAGKLVNRLLNRGLAERKSDPDDRRSDPDDRRAHRLYPTGKPRALLAELEPLGEIVHDGVPDGIGRGRDVRL
jgi:DNA-binding MarR family transcriptional regulator